MRKHMGMFDEELLSAIDARAEAETGGNRRVLVERVMRVYLEGSASTAARAPVTNFDRLQGAEPAAAPRAHGPKTSFTPRPKGGKR